jgi:cyclic beta-1,2-glucan synthetase
MFAASSASGVASIREHCQIAIEKGSQFGIHGLPLIGTGDWNDGMNHVGAEGKGESVWLAWFLIDVLQRWIPLIKEKSPEDASHWKQRVQRIAAAAEQAAWDGEWYLRGYFDDGTPLGSHVNAEARIDSLPQSWAILCGAANPQRAQAAMDRAEEHLVRERDGLVLLFTPPFDVAEPHPGYIRGYPPGARENGGQYTHAALWLAQARARLGQGREAVRLLKIINPVERTLTPAGVQQYRGEPFAVAADVSSSPLRVGAAGWTWYTGSAGWMYRVWLEDVLGFQLRGDRLLIRPSLPEEWKGCTITYRYHDTTYRIVYERVASGNAVRIEGKGADGDRILLRNDQQQHEIRVSLGSLDEFASQQALLPAKSVNL